MNWYERIKRFYEEGLWDKDRVETAKDLGRITQEEYEKIIDS